MTSTAVAEITEKKYTVKEYFELEKNSEIRHEYYYGKLIEMPGESKIANRIAHNLIAIWRKPLIDKGYEIYSHNVKTEVKRQGIYRYPDVVVTPEVDDDEFLVEAPVIMVEVASQDSMKRDTVVKLKEYTAISSLKYYLIVAQDEASVQLYYRNGQEWSFVFFENMEDIILLPIFSLTISLADIYARVKFAESKSDI
jgi:Uma2 family endonuclease